MKTKRNLISALFLQTVTILSGLILPRLIISTFGSEVNGLVSSITQFLSFIALLEGGLGAVVLAELYKPIEDRNNQLVVNILGACERFFRKISLVFIVYTLILMLIYPVLIANDYSFAYVSTLILILSLNTLSQYLFAITNKLLLQADQKVYISNFVSAGTILINIILTVIIIIFCPNIHIVKLGSSLIFLLQPLIYRLYIDKCYDLNKENTDTKYELKNRWSGFSQNLAHFINMNTDIVLITMFISFKEVSVYTIYMLALNALRSIISTASNSFQSALGKYIAKNDKKLLLVNFKRFELIVWIVGVVCFSTCLQLLNSFVQIYTVGVNDVGYYRPIFALIMTLAQFVYVIREPYRLIVLAGGKFKETNFGSNFEAVLNIIISILLINFFSIVGVAIGTLIAITYRLVYLVRYLKKDLLCVDYNHYLVYLIMTFVVFVINIFIYFNFELNIKEIISFVLYGAAMCIANFVLTLLTYFIVHKIIGLKKIVVREKK